MQPDPSLHHGYPIPVQLSHSPAPPPPPHPAHLASHNQHSTFALPSPEPDSPSLYSQDSPLNPASCDTLHSLSSPGVGSFLSQTGPSSVRHFSPEILYHSLPSQRAWTAPPVTATRPDSWAQDEDELCHLPSYRRPSRGPFRAQPRNTTLTNHGSASAGGMSSCAEEEETVTQRAAREASEEQLVADEEAQKERIKEVSRCLLSAWTHKLSR